MKRRSLILAASGLSLYCAAGASRAQADDAAPVVAAPKIIEALSGKDIVLDNGSGNRPGGAQRPGSSRRGPSVSLQVQFLFGSSQLLPHGKRQLDQLAMALSDRALASTAFEIAGHTDAVGSAESNLRLSIRRADSVKDYLTTAHGLDAARLQTIGFGYLQLADPAHPEAAINRRVEVRRLPVAGRTEPTASPSTRTGGRLVPTPR